MGHAMSFFVDIYVPSNIKINKASVHVRAYKKPKKDVMLVLSHLHSFGKMILFPDDKYKHTYFLEKSTNLYANASVNSMLKCCFIFVYLSAVRTKVSLYFLRQTIFCCILREVWLLSKNVSYVSGFCCIFWWKMRFWHLLLPHFPSFSDDTERKLLLE